MELVWNLPGPARPGYVPRLGRALVFFGVLGFGVAVTTLLTRLGLYGHGPGVLASPVRSWWASPTSGCFSSLSAS
jgi:hypothetical protein